MPEWRSQSAPFTITSSDSPPRSMVEIAGVSASHMPVSQTSANSDFSSAAFSRRNGVREGDPLSSSPSRKIVTLTGSEPVSVFQARQASTKVIS